MVITPIEASNKKINKKVTNSNHPYPIKTNFHSTFVYHLLLVGELCLFGRKSRNLYFLRILKDSARSRCPSRSYNPSGSNVLQSVSRLVSASLPRWLTTKIWSAPHFIPSSLYTQLLTSHKTSCAMVSHLPYG